MKKSFTIIGLLILSGCSSVISSSDLYDFGEEQAMSGAVKLDRIDVKKRTLRQSVTEEDYKLYLDGYTNGLSEFCTNENAKRFGLAGKTYNGTCDDINPQFKPIYAEAYEFRAFVEQ